jgi:hypothetical protein
MRVWLDDERPMPSDFDIHVRTADEAIELLKTGKVTFISLDHDLGDQGQATGYKVAKFIEEAAYHNSIPRLRVYFHTMNPVGKANMKAAIRQAYLYWMEYEQENKNVFDSQT